MKLRDYQEEAVKAVFKAWETARRVLIVLPTGCGKTVVFSEIIRRLLTSQTSAPRALVLAHREELITQAKAKIEEIAEVNAEIEMGEFKTSEFFGEKAPVVVSTVQTQLNRKEKFSSEDFAAVIVDEAHHAVAKSYRETVDYYLENPDCKLLGVTATPDRADEMALKNSFDVVAYEYTVAQAIEDGWLVPVRQQLVKVESLDFSGVSTSAGDLNSAELAEVMEDEKNLHGIVAPTVEILGKTKKRAILFAASVKQAERISEIINRSELKSDWLCGATPKEERRAKLAKFKAGEIDVLCNVGVLTEGFDDSGVEVVIMARPTKSRALYAQMAGRGTRPAADIAARLGEIETQRTQDCASDLNATARPSACGISEIRRGQEDQSATGINFATGGIPPSGCEYSGRTIRDLCAQHRRALIAASSKPSCLIVDFVGNSGRHKLITSVDILGGKDLDEETAALAREKILEKSADDEALTTGEAIECARAEIAARKEREAKRREFVKATAKFVTIAVDPMNPFDLPPPEENPREAGKKYSLKQELVLRRLKLNPDKLPYVQGTAIIKENFRRMNDGVASLLQSQYLRKFNIPVPMSVDEAKRTLTRCFKR